MISKKDAIEFPFLKESSNLAKQMELKSNLDQATEEVCSFVDEYLLEVYHNRFFSHKPTEDFWLSRARFLLACVVINQIGKERAIHRFCEYESRHFVLKVEHKDRDMFPIYFNMVFEEVWGRPVSSFIERTQDGRFYAVKVKSFLRFRRKRPEYALINQYVVGGFVIMGRETLLHILQVGLEELLYERVRNMFRDIPVKIKAGEKLKESRFDRGVVLPPELLNLVNKFIYVDLHTSVYRSPPDKDLMVYDTEKLKQKVVKLKGTTPPCMSYILHKFSRGENVSHFERLTIATFLFARHDPMEQIVEMFSRAPNYDQKTTEYQLNQIKKTDYKTPNCSKIEENGICFRNSVCGGCHNPLQLIGTAR